jgi:hypothetical protein
MKPRWLGRDTVRAPHLILCLSAAEFKAAARHCDVTDPGQWMSEDRQIAVCHTWERSGRLVCVVCLHPDSLTADPIEVAAAICHESVHVFQRLCDSIGEDRPGREFEAYGIERIAERLMREFCRRVAGMEKMQ